MQPGIFTENDPQKQNSLRVTINSGTCSNAIPFPTYK